MNNFKSSCLVPLRKQPPAWKGNKGTKVKVTLVQALRLYTGRTGDSTFWGWARNCLHLVVKKITFFEMLDRNLELGKSFCRRGWVSLGWINLAQDKEKWRIIVKTKVNFRVSEDEGYFLNS
jgi:hypothetical protein